MSIFRGERIKLEIYGGSHEAVIGVRMTGIPRGTQLDREALGRFMSRRAPGRDKFSTPRVEADAVEFLSGVSDDTFTGEEIHAIIRSSNQRSRDYSQFADMPRPSHADYVAKVKYGDSVNMAGGGPFSGRMTAPLCIAGAIALSILEKKGITIGAHLHSVGDAHDVPFDSVALSTPQLQELKLKPFPALSSAAKVEMQAAILNAKASCDSIGAVVECAVLGLPVGLGGPLFEGLESRISALAFAVPAVKGIEFGSGFACTKMLGSEHNDPFAFEDGRVVTLTNNSGGIQGGISNGMPLIFRCAFKPTPSISKEQRTVSLSRGESASLMIGGRHDPCVAVRATPVMEAVAALAILDAID